MKDLKQTENRIALFCQNPYADDCIQQVIPTYITEEIIIFLHFPLRLHKFIANAMFLIKQFRITFETLLFHIFKDFISLIFSNQQRIYCLTAEKIALNRLGGFSDYGHSAALVYSRSYVI